MSCGDLSNGEKWANDDDDTEQDINANPVTLGLYTVI